MRWLRKYVFIWFGCAASPWVRGCFQFARRTSRWRGRDCRAQRRWNLQVRGKWGPLVLENGHRRGKFLARGRARARRRKRRHRCQCRVLIGCSDLDTAFRSEPVPCLLLACFIRLNHRVRPGGSIPSDRPICPSPQALSTTGLHGCPVRRIRGRPVVECDCFVECHRLGRVGI